MLGLGSEGLGVCVRKVPSQAKHSRQGSFFLTVAVWGMNHLRPNISDRGLLLSVCQCGEGVISSQTCQTGVFLRCTISGQTFQTGVFFSKCGCVGNEPSQAKHSRQGSFTECVSVWGRCHLRPNTPDRGLLLSVWLCGKGAISGQIFQTGVFY